MTITFRNVAHHELTDNDRRDLGRFFDDEYLTDFGPWTPDNPYGYAPAEMHVMAFDGDVLVGHVGFQRRRIVVGERTVTVGGTGGVLVDRRARGDGLGRALMGRAGDAMRAKLDVEFGYLGCRPSVVPFYEAAGWTRIHARERCLSRIDHRTVVESDDSPLLILPVAARLEDWPVGPIDLMGCPW